MRSALLEFQRQFAWKPPGGARGAVLDGRDIGTVVCPDATVKFFVTASPEVRAHRRWLELRQADETVTPEEVLASVRARDARDASRDTAPMVAAEDALLFDTSEMTVEAAVAASVDIVRRKLGR